MKCLFRHDGGFWTSPLTGALVSVSTFDPKAHQCYSTAVGGWKTGTTGQTRDCKGWAWTAQISPDCQSDYAFFQFLLETRKYLKWLTCNWEDCIGYRHQKLMSQKTLIITSAMTFTFSHSRGRGIFSRLSGSLLPEFTSKWAKGGNIDCLYAARHFGFNWQRAYTRHRLYKELSEKEFWASNWKTGKICNK